MDPWNMQADRCVTSAPSRGIALAAALTALGCGVTRAEDTPRPASDAGQPELDGSREIPADADLSSTDASASDANGNAAGAGASEAGTDAQAADAGPTGFVSPHPGMTPGPGTLPPAIESAAYLGALAYDNAEIARDLGFSGVVNGESVWTFGDTLLVPPAASPIPCSTDSYALGDRLHPMTVHDKSVASSGCPLEWIPWDSAELANGGGGRYGEGGTNVIEYAPNKGLAWFLKNDRGTNGLGIRGAGVATVTADASGAIAVRGDDTMWNSFEPWWGDVGVTYDALDQCAYVYGHGPTSANLSDFVYLAKVPAALATDVSAYRYWDQSTASWTAQRFANGQLGTMAVTSAQALFPEHALGQSNAFWNTFYNTWMFVYGTGFGYTDIQVMTASKLEGPWTKGFTVASTCPNGTCSAIRYAIAPHPEYDLSGKTLLVTWTDSNRIYGVRLTWK
jgi:hypothetical protein